VRAVIIFFAKTPAPGNVKTRLVPPLTPIEAAELHKAFVSDLVSRFETLAHYDLQLHTDQIEDAWPGLIVPRKLQISGSLGLKMFHALRVSLHSGYQRAAIIGTDAPTLPLAHVEALMQSNAQVAIGPAEDGGFWGISASETNPNMFSAVTWSEPDTLAQTVASIKASGLSVEIGPLWYDVDSPSDLERLLRGDDLPPATGRWTQHYRPTASSKATRRSG
jgi:uncharacterized protein